MRSFEELLKESAALHGHLCPGQVLGVRMALLGCRLVGIDAPALSKDLVIYVEIDRCATDAIQAVTGCKLGKRTLKYLDYGKMAATFVNLASGKAMRVVAREDSREAAWDYAPPGADKKAAQLHAYRVMPEERLFSVMAVHLAIPATDLPGHPLRRVTCELCGEGINDGREVQRQGRTLCRPCAVGAYYTPITPALATPARDSRTQG